MLLQQVPEDKRQKNRLHLDLRTADVDTDVRRVLGLGATLITDQAVMEDDWRWHILADPTATSSACYSRRAVASRRPQHDARSAATRGCQWPREAARRWENDRHVDAR